jgi:pre-mRNA-splicing factor ATP-dependent RNA helicase DHX38/PRP16
MSRSFSSTPSSHSRNNNNNNSGFHNNSNRRRNTGTNDRSGRTPSNLRSSRSDWDAETPLQGPRDGGGTDDRSPEPNPLNEEYDSDFDRQFYDNEEDGRYLVDQSAAGPGGAQDMGRFLFENSKTRAREADMAKRRLQQGNHGGQHQPQQLQRSERFNAKKSALQADQEAWEESRLLSSGAAVRSTIDLDAETLNNEKDMSRVTLLVHQVKPPFLSDDKVSFSTVREAVPTVKDASSDFAKMSRAGSATLRYIRANKDKNAMRQKFWELGGTRMGDAVGVAKTANKEGDGDDNNNNTNDEDENGEIDYKKSSGFAQHMKKKKGDDGKERNDEAVSNFAKTKSIREQREYLPVYSVRDELVNVIRENSCVVIVGETGSGKVRFIARLLATNLGGAPSTDYKDVRTIHFAVRIRLTTVFFIIIFLSIFSENFI